MITFSPQDAFIQCINQQKQKEEGTDIWEHSPYKDLVKLQSNNVGNVGETFIQTMCLTCGIPATIDGSKTKECGGGAGDGLINGFSVEVKTAARGSSTPSFQHEMGEAPWKSNYMIFIDVAPFALYITIFENFTEETYKRGGKCETYFPTKSITWRKGSGAFKLDTTEKINEENILKGHTFKIDGNCDVDKLRTFILLKIK
jgi:hypothetical protein